MSHDDEGKWPNNQQIRAMTDAKAPTSNTPAAQPSTTNPPPSAVEAIEEDDEFEEFEPCQWDKNDEDVEDSQQWKVRRVTEGGQEHS